MKSPISLKRRPVLWLLLPALPLLVIVANASESQGSIVGYWTWTVAHSVLLILVPAGVAAVGAALEAARLRTHADTNPVSTRSPIIVLVDAFAPSFLAGLVLQAIAVVVVALDVPGGESDFPVAMALTVASIILFHTALGFALGSALRPVVAIPMALVASFCWLGYTGSLSWPAPRHLAGLVIETCCGYEAEPAAASLAAAATFSLLAAVGLLTASSAFLRLGTSVRRVGVTAAVLLVAAGLVIGLTLAKDLGPTADSPRGRAELQCAGATLDVCLYPEQLAEADGDGDVRLQIEELTLRLRATGIELPARVVAAWQSGAEGEWALTYRPDMSEQDIAVSIASTVYDLDPGRCDGTAALARYEAADVLSAVLLGAMLPALTVEDLTSLTSADPSLLGAYRSAPAADANRWVAEAADALRTCDGDVPRVPGGRDWTKPTDPLPGVSETDE